VRSKASAGMHAAMGSGCCEHLKRSQKATTGFRRVKGAERCWVQNLLKHNVQGVSCIFASLILLQIEHLFFCCTQGQCFGPRELQRSLEVAVGGDRNTWTGRLVNLQKHPQQFEGILQCTLLQALGSDFEQGCSFITFHY